MNVNGCQLPNGGVHRCFRVFRVIRGEILLVSAFSLPLREIVFTCSPRRSRAKAGGPDQPRNMLIYSKMEAKYFLVRSGQFCHFTYV
jgi:hypothetical protein